MACLWPTRGTLNICRSFIFASSTRKEACVRISPAQKPVSGSGPRTEEAGSVPQRRPSRERQKAGVRVRPENTEDRVRVRPVNDEMLLSRSVPRTKDRVRVRPVNDVYPGPAHEQPLYSGASPLLINKDKLSLSRAFSFRVHLVFGAQNRIS